MCHPSLSTHLIPRTVSSLFIASLIAAGTGSASAQPQRVGAPPEASNMRLIGHNDLQARSAYQPVIQHQGDRWILYVGHHGGTDAVPQPVNTLNGQPEPNGTSIVDVTDPSNPKYLKHLPGQPGKYEAGGGQMVRICDGKSLPKGDRNAVYMLRTFGGQAHEIFDVADPANPKLITRLTGIRDTHKSFWECDTGIAYLVSGVPGWRVTRMTEVYDLSDPAKPVKIRDFGLVGQQPGSTGETPVNLHGMISLGPQINRIYFGYGTNTGGVVQIIDREKLLNGPKEPTPENLMYPEVGRLNLSSVNGAHTVFPLLKMDIPEFKNDKVGRVRDMLMIVNEQILNECTEPRQIVFFADITVEKRPTVVSNFSVPEASGDFCSRGGRFGAHSSNESTAPVFNRKLAFITYFNAGVRAVDIRDPYNPREVGYFIPAITEATDKRCIKVDGQERCKTAIQSNNVETDERGYIYVVDRANTGVHILEVTGAARAIAGLP